MKYKKFFTPNRFKFSIDSTAVAFPALAVKIYCLTKTILFYHHLENRSERSISEETRDFVHQCEQLQKLLSLTASAPCSLPVDNSGTADTSQQEVCLGLEREVQGLRRKVEDAGSLASGGIFEWVDSPLVEVSGGKFGGHMNRKRF